MHVSTTGTIPEPSTLVLLGGAGLALAARRLRSRRMLKASGMPAASDDTGCVNEPLAV
jgi:hypothetical protein